VYGTHTLTQTFTIGQSLIVVASTQTHYMNLYRGGKLIDRWPISTGRPGDDTPNGTYVTLDKGNPIDMIGPGYNIEVPWSVRFTWSGDYLHDAYWSVGEQGFTNVSHGCVNMPPADAEIYYNMEVPGDPVTITGSPKGGTWDNGWTQWFLPWNQYVAGSALHMAVQAGPSGSTFVTPATLPVTTASAPLGTSAVGNAALSHGLSHGGPGGPAPPGCDRDRPHQQGEHQVEDDDYLTSRRDAAQGDREVAGDIDQQPGDEQHQDPPAGGVAPAHDGHGYRDLQNVQRADDKVSGRRLPGRLRYLDDQPEPEGDGETRDHGEDPVPPDDRQASPRARGEGK
jgi:hypothetical protein